MTAPRGPRQAALPMYGQVPALDRARTRDLRDEGIARVEQSAVPTFLEEALAAVRRTAETHREFIVDQVWERMTGKPFEARAMGPIMLRAVRLGWIEKTERFTSSAQPLCHGNPRRIWRSRLTL